MLLLSCPVVFQLFAILWTTACQASLSLTISWSLPKFMFIVSVMPSSQLILWCTLLLLPSIFTSISEFFDESSVHIRWPKYWIFSFNIVFPVNMQGWSPLRLTGLISLLSKGLLGVFSSTTVRRHQFFGVLPSLQSSCHVTTLKTIALTILDLCWQSDVSAFQHTV